MEEKIHQTVDIGFFSMMVDIPKPIVKMVEYYCVSRFDIMTSYARRDHLLLDKLEVLNRGFLHDKPLPLLVQLQTAAIKLKIKSLLNLTRNAIVDMLDGKSADEIRKIFNMPDFEHDAWKNIYVEEPWTIERMSYTTSYQRYPKLLAPAVPNAEVTRVSDNSTTNTSANDLSNGPEVGNPGNNEGSESGLEEEVLDEPAPVQKNSNETGPVKKPESFVTQEDKKSYASTLGVFKAAGSPASGHVQTSNLRWAPANTDQHKPRPAKLFPEPEISVPMVVNESESSNVHDDGHLIYVWNLPMNVTVTQLEEEFNKFGPIKRNGVRVINNKREGFCIGCLEFESLDSMRGAIMAPSITIGNRQVFVTETARVSGGVGGVREWYSFGSGHDFRGRGGYYGCLTSPYKSAVLGGGGGGGGGRVQYSSGKGGRFRSRGGYFGGQSFSRGRGRSQGEFCNRFKGS